MAADGLPRENTASDGDTDLQDEQDQEEAAKSKQNHLEHPEKSADPTSQQSSFETFNVQIKQRLEPYGTVRNQEISTR